MQEPGAKRLTVGEKISTNADESVPQAVASESPSKGRKGEKFHPVNISGLRRRKSLEVRFQAAATFD
jgi:hypothetical protein